MTRRPGQRAAPADSTRARRYWDGVATSYQRETVISCDDVHYGPLVPGDAALQLLPTQVAGWRCLEVGCGAAQNAICLARRGGQCTALDISAAQLQAGARLARRHGVDLALIQADMQALPLAPGPRFDLILSAYALPFVADAAACIRAMAGLLRPGGMLVLSTAHPLAAGEWLEVDGEPGLFLADYFAPPVDRRRRADGGAARCRAVPLGTVFGWLTAAGLQVEALREPQALPAANASERESGTRMPYWSRAWLDHAAQFARIPVVAVFKAAKPVAGQP